MDSDSDIEIVSATNQAAKQKKTSAVDLTQDKLPSLSPVLLPSNPKWPAESNPKSPSLAPIPKQNNPAANQLKSPFRSPIRIRIRKQAKPPGRDASKSPSLSPIPTRNNLNLSAHQSSSVSPSPPKSNLKRPVDDDDSSTRPSKDQKKNKRGSQRSGNPRNWLLSPPPSRLNSKQAPSSKSQGFLPPNSDSASRADDAPAKRSSKTATRSKRNRDPGALINLDSSPVPSLTKPNEEDESSSLSSLEFSKSSDDENNPLRNPIRKSASRKVVGSRSSQLNSASEAKDVPVEEVRNSPIQSNQGPVTEAIVHPASRSLSVHGLPSNPSKSHISRSNSQNPLFIPSSPDIPLASLEKQPGDGFNMSEIQSKDPCHSKHHESLKEAPIELDSEGVLSDLESIFGMSKPSQSTKSFAEKRVHNSTQGGSNNNLSDLTAQRSSQAQAAVRNVSTASGSHLQSHRSKSTATLLDDVDELPPRSHSALQKLNQALVGQSSDKAKGKQPAQSREISAGGEDDLNYSANVEHDDGHLSHIPVSDRPPSVDPNPTTNPRSKASSTRLEKQAKAAEAKLAREAKKAAKEQEKLQNRLTREANKLTLNRKETVAEVMMRVPKSLKKSKLHPLTKACEVLVDRISSTEDCRMNLPKEIDDESTDEPQGVVRWIRTTNKEWDEEKDSFVPLGLGQTKETTEPTVLIVWTGKEVDEIIASGADQLLKKAQAIKSHYPQDQLFIVISGLQTLLLAERKREDAMIRNEARAKLANRRNEVAHTSKVVSSYGGNIPKNNPDKILKELEMLKIITKAFIIRVEDKNEFANWLWEMTLEIGVRPYKARRQDLKSALRLEVSGTKGSNNEDTYIKMLSSLTRVTENEAKGIVSKFPTIKSLYHSWERGIEKNGIHWAQDMLIGCSKSNSMTGVNSGRKIGKVTSKRIFDILYNVKNGDACI